MPLALMVLFLFAAIAGMIGASFNPFLGAGMFMGVMLLGLGPTPAQRRFQYLLAWVAVAVGLIIGTILWTTIGPGPDISGNQALTFASVTLTLALGMGASVLTLGAILYTTAFLVARWVCAIGADLGLPESDVRIQILRLVLGVEPPYVIVGDGKIQQAKPPGLMPKIGGPGIVIIKPANAIAMEWGGEVTQVRGPGIARTKMFERVREVVDLRPQWGIIDAENLVTREGEPLRLRAQYRYHIETLQESLERQRMMEEPDPLEVAPQALDGNPDYSRQAVWRAVFRPGSDGWKQATQAAVKEALSNEISERSLANLFGNPLDPLAPHPPTLEQIAAQARSRAWLRSAAWGVCVESIAILALTAPDKVRNRTLAKWEAELTADLIKGRGGAEANIIREKAQAEAQGIDAIETVKVGARKRTFEDLLEFAERASVLLPDNQARRFVVLLEKLAIQMGKDRASAFRYLQALEAMSQNPQARVIISAGDPNIVIEAPE